MKMRLPIALKLAFLTSLLVVGVAVSIAWKNSELFSQISTDREESNARLLTSSKALEVEAILESYVEKLSLLASENSDSLVLTGDVTYFKLESDSNGEQLSEYRGHQVSVDTLGAYRQILQGHQNEISSLKKGQVFIASTGAQMKEPYLLVGAPVARENGVVTHWAWGLFKLGRLQSSFEGSSSIRLSLLDSKGKVIVHPDQKKTLSAQDLSGTKLVSKLLSENIREHQQYHDDKLFSSSKTLLGPMVIAEISQSSILAPSKLAKDTSYFLLSLVLSASFFLSVVFAHTISRNLEKLRDFSHRIAEGDFDVQASTHIRSHDEIGTLAIAFDQMTVGLKERDKIKNIFNKFHGSTITEQLLSQDDLRKSRNCEAVIFFSDIRGFTDFSNSRSPEEVVEMLNSYFEVMVKIINDHGGIVDKFVGDAIMAVWGAPTSTENDAQNAVMACLKMRSALAELNEQRISIGHPPIRMGMGLHAGPVVSGTIGSADRLEYTVIGDTVNTASRIESSTKSFGTDLLVSEEVLNRVGEGFISKEAGSTKVKGKDEPLILSRVEGYVDENGNTVIVRTPYSSYEAEEDAKVKIVA